jgi:hypothetical protein
VIWIIPPEQGITLSTRPPKEVNFGTAGERNCEPTRSAALPAMPAVISVLLEPEEFIVELPVPEVFACIRATEGEAARERVKIPARI